MGTFSKPDPEKGGFFKWAISSEMISAEQEAATYMLVFFLLDNDTIGN